VRNDLKSRVGTSMYVPFSLRHVRGATGMTPKGIPLHTFRPFYDLRIESYEKQIPARYTIQSTVLTF
jgi:hypothetical protein